MNVRHSKVGDIGRLEGRKKGKLENDAIILYPQKI